MISPTNFIARHFGSKKGLLNLYNFNVLQLQFRAYSRYRKLLASFSRAVFFCMGNICRSPLVKKVFRQHRSTETVSLRLETQPAHPAHPPVVKASVCRGYDLSNHSTTCVDSYTAQQGDLHVCTAPAHLLKLSAVNTQQIVLPGLFEGPRRVHIHDPYSSTYEFTEKTVEYIVHATETWPLSSMRMLA